MKTNGLAALAVLALAAASCGGNNNEERNKHEGYIPYEEAEEQFVSTLTAADTAEVLAAGRAFMDSIAAGHAAEAFASLCDPSTLQPIGAARAKRLAGMYSRPVAGYELVYYAFSLDGLNDMKYRVTFDTPASATMSIMLNPVKTDSAWILCLKTDKIPSKDLDKPIHAQTPIPIE